MNLVECPSHPLLQTFAPVVFNGMITEWPASKWTPELLAESLGDVKLGFRIGFESSDVVWENDCHSADATVQEYVEWLTEENLPDSNTLSKYTNDNMWCYADYKYIINRPKLIDDIDWSVFGFKGRTGKESTFWMGSKGAYTPCHYDTYGCNLVAQIYGRKRWILFPPSDTRHLYPTRLPYEESSVYSQVNIRNPDLWKHPKFNKCKSYLVTLEPGQVLFVPRHWWHHVECLENSISINSWIEMAEDDEGRFEEAVSRALVSSTIKLDPDHDKGTWPYWLNKDEEMPTTEDCWTYIATAWHCLRNPTSTPNKGQTQDTEAQGHSTHYIPNKRQKTDPENKNGKTDQEVDVQKTDCELESVLDKAEDPVEPIKMDELFKLLGLPEERLTLKETDKKNTTEFDLTPQYFVNCVSHPDVVSLICKIMKENAHIK